MNIVGFVFIAMASLQTNALSSPAAANAAMKASTQTVSLQNGGSDHGDFAALLNGTQASAPEKTPAALKPAAKTRDKNQTAADASPAAGKHGAKANSKADGKTEKTVSKADRKSAGKTEDMANAQTEATKSAAAAQPQQTADATDQDGDAANDNGAAQTATNQSSDASNPQTAQQDPSQQPPLPAAAPQAQQVMAAAAVAPAPSATTQTNAASPQTDAVMAPTNAIAAAGPGNNGVAAGPPSKGGRTAAASPQPTGSAGSKAADSKTTPNPVPANGGSDPDTTTVKRDTPASAAAADNLKSLSHPDAKDQGGAATDVAADAATQPQPNQTVQSAPQPAPPAPAPSAPAANPMAVTTAAPAAADAGGAAALSASVHVGPQGPTPNVNSLAVEIAARSQSGSKEFQIRLDPPELGHVEVRLSIDASGKAQAHMTADQQQTLDLLKTNSPTLTSALRDAGLDVSQSGLNFSLRGQDRQGSSNSHGGAPSRGSSISLAAVKTIDAVQSANPYLSSAGDARLDIHV